MDDVSYYYGYRLDPIDVRDPATGLLGCIVSVRHGERADVEVFRHGAWATDRLARHHGRETTELVRQIAGDQVRANIDHQEFRPGTYYREVHDWDETADRWIVAQDRLALDSPPETPLPQLPGGAGR